MLGIELKYKGAYPPLSRRRWNREITIPTLEKALGHWHDKFRAKHFTEEGAKEYGYTARKGTHTDRSAKGFGRTYVGRKLRQKGHNRPLVWSGVSERLSRIKDIRANSKRGRAVLPPGFNRKHPRSRVNMREEVTAVSRREESALVVVADRSIHSRLNAIKETQTRKL